MVAATTLGYIVVEAGDIEQVYLGQILDQLGSNREVFFCFGQQETAHVLNDLQGMCVDGVDVKQVVLHLASDLSEFRQVAAEYSVTRHAPQLQGHLVW